MNLTQLHSIIQRLLRTERSIFILTLIFALAITPLLSAVSAFTTAFVFPGQGFTYFNFIIMLVGIAALCILPTVVALRSPLGVRATRNALITAGIAFLIWFILFQPLTLDHWQFLSRIRWASLFVFSLLIMSVSAALALAMRHFSRARLPIFHVLLAIPFLITFTLAIPVAAWAAYLAPVMYMESKIQPSHNTSPA